MSKVIKTDRLILKNSGTAGAAPSVNDLEYGELAINWRDGKGYIKVYDGTQDVIIEFGSVNDGGGGSGGDCCISTMDNRTYTANQGDTTFAVNYTGDNVFVYKNGMLLAQGTEYNTNTSGTSITLASPASSGDVIAVCGLKSETTDTLTLIPKKY